MSTGPLHARIITRRHQGFTLDVEIAIEPGETVALLGPNGAGKSTTVSAIAGLTPIDEGRIRIGEEILDAPEEGTFIPPEGRRIGVVFQDYLLFPHLRVIDNVAFGLRSRGVERDQAVNVARDWINRLGLGGMERRKPRDLSGGQAQRVALARALAAEPDLLLLDEPLSALDVGTRVELRRTLAEHLGRFQGPRLLITHDPTEAFLLADVIHVIEHGSVTQSGTADEIRLRPQTKYAADLADANLISGTADGGRVITDSVVFHIADHEISGPVLLTIHPNAVSLHRNRPEGSQRNTWSTIVDVVEPLGDRARIRTGPPLPLTVEVTREAIDALHLRPGVEVWVAVKATEIGVEPQGQ